MTTRLLHDESFFQELIGSFSITVTQMFRDPVVFRCIREKVVPFLKTYPFIKIWHAGCATGEEAYSLAILLTEEDLYNRMTMYATDFNDAVLATAKDGIFSLENARQFATNYQKSGGITSFSQYYHARYGSIAIAKKLKQNITFANHNLATDNVFGEMHFIVCRNVLIYFDRDLQNRVLQLFYDSLPHGGFLCIGSKESLDFSDVMDQFHAVDRKCRIFQKY